MTFNFLRFGGVHFDLPSGYLAKLDRFVHYIKERMPEYASMLHENEIFLARTKGIGLLQPDLALELSCTGPTLRGSGVARDLRKDEPYEVYSKLEFDVCFEKGCDSYSRFLVRYREILESIRIIEQILHRIPEGPVMAKVPKVIKPQAGQIYSRVEAPTGELGVYLVSDGSTKPFRVKIRAPSFSNLMALSHMIEGSSVPDVVATLASLAPTMGEADR